jgi:hypothetical protein
MIETPEEIGIEDTSSLTDADWAEINKLVRAYNSGGEKSLERALGGLLKGKPVRYARVYGAFFPNRLREALKDEMAVRGITEEDLQDFRQKSEGATTKQ